MIALLLSVMTASLLGSLHCAGMCGGLVAFYAGSATGGIRWGAHASYNAGRLLGYLGLGVAAGAAGAIVDLAGALTGIRPLAAVASGLLIVLWGLHSLLAARGAAPVRLPSPHFLKRLFGRIAGRVATHPVGVRAAAVGLASALLPCGWLYAFVITAAGTGGAWAGAVVMTAFWIGTLPVMLGMGAAAHMVSIPLRRHLPTLCAIAMMLLGLVVVVERARLRPSGWVPGATSSAPAVPVPRGACCDDHR